MIKIDLLDPNASFRDDFYVIGMWPFSAGPDRQDAAVAAQIQRLQGVSAIDVALTAGGC